MPMRDKEGKQDYRWVFLLSKYHHVFGVQGKFQIYLQSNIRTWMVFRHHFLVILSHDGLYVASIDSLFYIY